MNEASVTRAHETLSVERVDDVAADRKARKAEYLRTYYRKRRATKLCVGGRCAENAKPGHVYCSRHLRAMARAAQVRRAERLEKGLCIACGEARQFWGQLCFFCRNIRAKDPLPNAAKRAIRNHRERNERERQLRRKEGARNQILELIISGKIQGQQAEALRLYGGIEFGKWRSKREVGRLMNLSRERVRQLILEATIKNANSPVDCLNSIVAGKPKRPRQSTTSTNKLCPSCKTDPSKVMEDGSYLYECCGLTVTLVGLPFHRCHVCKSETVLMPAVSELRPVITRTLIWKAGPMTGRELRWVRMAMDLPLRTFAAHLGIASLTLVSWEKFDALRYRDDLSVRVVIAALSPDLFGTVDVAKLLSAVRGTRSELHPLKVDV